jgi:hypothetical protein
MEKGDPAEEILRVAEETKCDLIMIGTHGRTGLGRLLMGSVAEQVVRKAHCPVLTVKAPLQTELPTKPPETDETNIAEKAVPRELLIRAAQNSATGKHHE